MAKHSKGKHAATRAELKDKARRDKLKAEEADQASEAVEDTPGSPEPETTQDTSASEGASVVEAAGSDTDSEDAAQAVQEPVAEKSKKGSKKAHHKSTSKRSVARKLGIAFGAVAEWLPSSTWAESFSSPRISSRIPTSLPLTSL